MNDNYHDQPLTYEQIRNLKPAQLRELVSNVNRDAQEVWDIRKQQLADQRKQQTQQESKS